MVLWSTSNEDGNSATALGIRKIEVQLRPEPDLPHEVEDAFSLRQEDLIPVSKITVPPG